MNEYSNMTRAERLKSRRNKLKLAPSYVAKYVGVSRVTYINWEEGKVEDIAWPKFRRLAEVLLTTDHWLEYGKPVENYICNDANGEIKKSLDGIHILNSHSIPVIGLLGDVVDLSKTKTNEYVDMPAKNAGIFALRVTSDVSICRAHAGDALICDSNTELLAGEEIYIVFNDLTTVVCAFNYESENQLNCTTENGKAIYDLDSIDTVSPIVAVARNGNIKKRSK